MYKIIWAYYQLHLSGYIHNHDPVLASDYLLKWIYIPKGKD